MPDKVEILRIEVDQQAAQKELAAIEQNLVRLRNEQAKYKKELRDSNGANKEAANNLVSVNNEIKKNTTSRQQLIKVMNTENNSLNAMKQRISSLIVERNKLDLSTNQGRQKFNQLNAEILKYNTYVRKAEMASGSFGRNVGNYPQIIGRSILAFAGLTSGIYALFNVIRNTFNIVKNFDAAQATLASILGKTREQIRGLEEDSIRYGKTTLFTATQVTQLQTELAKLGFTVEEIKASTPGILRFAEATGSDLASSAQIAGAGLRAMGLAATETDRVVSVLAVATTKSALKWQDYETAISTVFPVARAFGFTIEQTTAFLGKLRDAGFDASKSSVALRNIFLSLADANGKLAKALGGPVRNFDELIPALRTLNDRGVDLNETLQLTDKRSVAAFNQILIGADKVKELATGLTDVNDQLNAMVKVKLDSMAADMTKFTSAWEGFILSVENGQGVVGGFFRSVIQGATGAIKGLQHFRLMFKREANLTAEDFQVILDPLNDFQTNSGKLISSITDGFEKLHRNLTQEQFNTYFKLFKQQFIDIAKQEGESQRVAEGLWNAYVLRRQTQFAQETKSHQDALDKQTEAERKAAQERLKINEDEAIKAAIIRSRAVSKELESRINKEDIVNNSPELKGQDELNRILIQKTKERNAQIAQSEAETQAKILAIKRATLNNELQLTSSIIGSIGDMAKQETVTFKVLKTAEALISTYAAIDKTLADPKLVFPLDVITSIAIGAQGFANVAAINGITFASGGKIGDRGVHLKPDSKGDNRLIVASDKEVILNQKQQAKIGANVLKQIGIPGYADGGYVGSMAGRNVISEANNSRTVINTLKSMAPPVVSIEEFTKVQNRIRIKERVSRS